MKTRLLGNIEVSEIDMGCMEFSLTLPKPTVPI